MTFRGMNPVNLDAKGRMPLPAKYRDALNSECGGELVATIDIDDRCLLLYPVPAWERVEAQVNALPNLDENTRRLQRLLIGHAADLRMDGQGRILLPAALREYARLEKSVALVGQSHKFEIWNDEQWELRREQWLQLGSRELVADSPAREITL